MSEPKAFSSGVQFAWDSTSIKLAETCLRKYQLKMIQGWQPHRKSVHLIFGGHYATALEHFYKYLALGKSRDEAELIIVRETLVATWDSESAEPWQSDHNTKTRENLIRTIVWYLDQFREDSCTTVHLSNGAPAVEYSFALPVDDGVVFAGHLDRVVEYSGKPYVQDQKTTGTTITPRYFEGYDPDTQMSMYTFAGKAIFGIPVKGVMIDAAQIAVGFTRFERGFTFRDEGQLNEWYDGAMWHIEKARTATKENYFPMNASSCGNFGGCEFRHICSRSPSVRENFLKADFSQQKRWDPLESR
jgi:hypothetical protein